MSIICLITAGYLIYDGFGDGIEYALALFVTLTVGSYIYERYIDHGEF